jgi:hypothetical protein
MPMRIEIVEEGNNGSPPVFVTSWRSCGDFQESDGEGITPAIRVWQFSLEAPKALCQGMYYGFWVTVAKLPGATREEPVLIATAWDESFIEVCPATCAAVLEIHIWVMFEGLYMAQIFGRARAPRF